MNADDVWDATLVAFLDDVIDNPNDQSIKLILADWLEDCTDYELARGMRLAASRMWNPWYPDDEWFQRNPNISWMEWSPFWGLLGTSGGRKNTEQLPYWLFSCLNNGEDFDNGEVWLQERRFGRIWAPAFWNVYPIVTYESCTEAWRDYLEACFYAKFPKSKKRT